MPWRLLGTSTDGELDVALDPPKVATIGREVNCTIHLVQRQVSRIHAELHWAPGSGADHGHWRVRDCGSTSGTFLNGVKLTAHREVRLYHADSIEIHPWRFQVESPSSDHTVAEAGRTLVEQSDSSEEFVALAAVQSPADLAQGLLVRLLAASEDIAKSEDEAAVGQATVEALASATGFSNVAFLRPGSEANVIEVVSEIGAISGSRGELQISRSLLKRARNGIYVHRGGGAGSGTLGASLASLSIRQAICVPVEAGTMFFGWLYLDNRSGGASESHELEAAGFAAAIARLAGLSLSNIARGRMQQRFDLEHQQMFGGTMRALIAAIDAKDPYTRGHSDRVSEFAVLLARAAMLSDEHIEQVRVCGLVHDIGKIGVPEEILRKPTHLEPEEFARIREHPAIGHTILRDIPQMRELLPGVLEHHERWDGTGYPNKIKGEEISRLGRLLCIADCFDAMTSARFYRPARTIAEVRAEIERCLGTHFDPELGRIFLSLRDSELAARISTATAPLAR